MSSLRSPATRRQKDEKFLAGNSVRFLPQAAVALAAMLRAIERAKHQVLLEMYWLDDDEVGSRFFRALADAATRGVKVIVVYDAVGSWTTGQQHFRNLQICGAEVLAFGALSPLLLRLRFDLLTQRDHRKLILVDNEVGFVGGVNIANAWAPKVQGGEGWRDEVVEVRGPVLQPLTEVFLRTYLKLGGLQPCLPCPVLAPVGPHQVAVLVQNGRLSRRATLRTYLRRIRSAKKSILLANAYFVPTSRMLRALIKAAARGVDVKLLLPCRSDVPIVKYASRFTWERLLRGGVKIYEFQPSILHSKTAVIDGEWTTVGSFNFDHMSSHSNQELNLSVLDHAFALCVERSFQEAMTPEAQVDLQHFRSRSTLARWLEQVAYAIRSWL